MLARLSKVTPGILSGVLGLCPWQPMPQQLQGATSARLNEGQHTGARSGLGMLVRAVRSTCSPLFEGSARGIKTLGAGGVRWQVFRDGMPVGWCRADHPSPRDQACVSLVSPEGMQHVLI